MDDILKRFTKIRTKNVIEALRLCQCAKARDDEFFCAKSCCPFAFPDQDNLVDGLYVCLKYELKTYIFGLEKSIKAAIRKQDEYKDKKGGV